MSLADKTSNDKPSPKGSKPAPKAPVVKVGALPKTSAGGTETKSAIPAGLLTRRRKDK